MGVAIPIAGAVVQGVQGMGSKQAGQRAAATGERQLGENEAFAGGLGQGSMGALNSAFGGFQGLAGGPSMPNLQQFDIGGVSNTQQQAIQNALQFGQNQRNTALEQAGLGFNNQADALDAALAARGLSRDSGVAAGALTGLLGQQGQAMAELNRGISEQQGAMALQGAQFDAQNALGIGQLGVQQTLGLNQQGIDSALGAFNSQANALNMLGQLGMAGAGNVLANQQANMKRTGEAAGAAGEGKGAGFGGMFSGLGGIEPAEGKGGPGPGGGGSPSSNGMGGVPRFRP